MAADLPFGPHLLWAIPIFALITMFGAGAAMFTAASQVYFRDLTSFLPYFARIWLYTSPMLFYAEDVPQKLQPDHLLQPHVPDARRAGTTPSSREACRRSGLLAAGLAWAVAALMAGGLFFISREREFAVRL